MEQILDVLGAYIRGEISDVDSALVATVRHDFNRAVSKRKSTTLRDQDGERREKSDANLLV